MSRCTARLLITGLCLWSGLLVRAEYTRRTFGRSGQVCEEGFRKCVRWGATCENGTCVCQNGSEWKGHFACYPPDVFHAEIINDPLVRTLAREKVSLPVTCRYLFSHFRTIFSGWSDSTCEVMIHAYNAKHRGKVYVHGFDLALRILTPVSQVGVGDASFRVYGTAFQGNYTFSGGGAFSFGPDGPWNVSEPTVALYLPQTIVRRKYDPYNNFGLVEVDTCGFSMRLRPFDTQYGKDQVLVPGLALSVKLVHEPEWLSLDKVVALVPAGEPNVRSLIYEPDLEPEYAMILRVFRSGVTQNQPNAAQECTAAANVVTSCNNSTRRRLAFQTCTFILTTARLIRCRDPTTNGNDILNLFKRCFQSMCHEDHVVCSKVQDEVAECSKDLDLPEVTNFLHPDTCQFLDD